jgi:hypothetical protein
LLWPNLLLHNGPLSVPSCRMWPTWG